MNGNDDRPDPDALLLRVEEEEARARRGRLRIFFGFAPGVGKTYRMLQVARDLVSEQGQEVVVGIVETHGRTETAALVLGLELLPRRKVEYRGRTIEEFDLDAALARHPQVLLVDELAHTNAPGLRHAKRWQDVEALLDAGVDVLTTMNVQHLESLKDVIAQISRVQVRETVPDSVLDRSDTIELVDIAPEELLQRLKEGKVYLPEEARRAADSFFRRGNLLALRELALRRTAAHVDEDVLAYRERHRVRATWPVGERILVCVGPSPSSARLIRSAARISAGLRCPWIATYVEPLGPGGLREDDRERLEAHLRAAEALGATVTRLSGRRVSEAILDFARRHNITRIIIGKPRDSRARNVLRGSILDEVVRGSGDIDVFVFSGDLPGKEVPERGKGPARERNAGPYLWSALIVLATLALALALRGFVGLPGVEMLFLLAIMASALWFGRGPALLAAVLGVVAYDFSLVPPVHTLRIEDRGHLFAFAMLFGVGLVMSELAGRMRRQERHALEREQRTSVLYALSRELASTNDPDEIATITIRQASEVFGTRARVLVPGEGGRLVPLHSPSPPSGLDASALGVAWWAYTHDHVAGLGTDTLPGTAVLCAPLRVGRSRLGVLVLWPTETTPLRSGQRAFVEVFCRQVAVALERARLSREARRAALRARTEEMRSSLLASVSHALRTPLASITGAATTLRDEPGLAPGPRRELSASIVDGAERLGRLVVNLLDMTRLEAGHVALARDWIPFEELVGAALTRLEPRLEGRPIDVSFPAGAPLLLFGDPVLLEQLLVNLLENAVDFTPAGSPIAISARSLGDQIVVDVMDEGPGIPEGGEERIFEKFVRASGGRTGAGAGLGLPISQAIAQAHGGSITAGRRSAGGSIFEVVLPRGAEPPPPPGLTGDAE